MYPLTLDDAVEAAEVFAAIGDHHAAGDGGEALVLLDSFLGTDPDTTRHQLTHLVMTGCLVTASAIRERRAHAHDVAWQVRTVAQWTNDEVPPSDLAAMRAVTALLNRQDAQGIVAEHARAYGSIGLKGILAALLATYGRTVAPK